MFVYYINLASHPFGVDKSISACLALVKVRHIHLCWVTCMAGNVWFHMAGGRSSVHSSEMVFL